MSDRHTPADAAATVTHPPPIPWDHLFPTLPPDVFDAPLPSAAADEPVLDRFLAADPADLPAFAPAPVAAGSARERHALGAALACPDLFLVDVGPAGDAVNFAVDLAIEAARAGERVAVVTLEPADADAVLARLAEAEDLLLGRAVGPDERADHLPAASAERTAHTHGPAAVAAAAFRLNGTRHRLEAERAALTAARDAVHAARPSPEFTSLAASADRAAAELAAKQAEVATLSARLAGGQTAKPNGVLGLLKGLFAKPPAADQPAEVEPQLKAAEQALAALKVEADRLAAERDARQADAEQALLRASEALSAAGLPADAPADAVSARLDQVERELAATTAWADDLDARTAEVARRLHARVRVTVGPAAAAADPLFAAGPFDLVIVTDADHLPDADLAAAAALGGRWVLAGDPTGRAARGPAYRNGKLGFPRPTGVRRLWQRLHPPGRWEADGVQLVAHLTDPGAGPLTCEPLADRPDIELRFANAGGAAVLAAVAFPPTMTLADAKAFLAAELGEVRLAPCGPVRWHESADAAHRLLAGGRPDGRRVRLGGAGTRGAGAGGRARPGRADGGGRVRPGGRVGPGDRRGVGGPAHRPTSDGRPAPPGPDRRHPPAAPGRGDRVSQPGVRGR
ncbi:MAG: hypothetical protein U0871_14315 [Gemmataceae bacterium]